jgi:hypothetical protein
VLAPLQQVPAGDAHEVVPSDRALLLDRLASALTTTMSTSARSLRTLEPTGAAPELRQLQVELTSRATPADRALASATDGLVDAVDTLDAILRDHLVSPQPQRLPEAGPAQTPPCDLRIAMAHHWTTGPANRAD